MTTAKVPPIITIWILSLVVLVPIFLAWESIL